MRSIGRERVPGWSCEMSFAGSLIGLKTELKRLQTTLNFYVKITELQPNNELHRNLNLMHPGSYLSSV
jgi:hypothetical protein